MLEHLSKWIVARRDRARTPPSAKEDARICLDQFPYPWIRLRDGHLVDAHPGLAALIGVPLAERLGVPPAALFAPADAARFGAALRELDASPQAVECDLRLLHLNGESLRVRATGVRLARPDTMARSDESLWVLRTSDDETNAPPSPPDWMLDAERERRDAAMRAFAKLQVCLQAARAAADPAAMQVAIANADRAVIEATARLAAPPLRLTDLVASLTLMIADVARQSGVPCSLDDRSLGATLDDHAKRVVYRAVRDLLQHFTREWIEGEMRVSVEHTLARRLRITLTHTACSAAGVSQTVVPRHGLPSVTSLGLFGVSASIAGLGGIARFTTRVGDAYLAVLDVPCLADKAAPTDAAD